ncbi:MAG TPA: SUF system NifU family Fe-S cluster assembly protein [Pyrinomonadaceae bacterium]|nr:SUF system NifU family Fe-S cluster assembly protein [Pyrinomonadaceae bacterium]
MSSLYELYDEVMADHDKRPRNFRPMESPSGRAEGHNPVCGDNFVVYLSLDGDAIKDISFTGEGCRISKAAASMMTQKLKGKSRAEAEALFGEFHRMVLGELDEEATPNQLGHLKIFASVRNFPVRVKCASLPWHTMHAALHGQESTTTE